MTDASDGPAPPPDADVDLTGIRAFICDLDGVLTRTAETHFQAWKRMFDAYLRQRNGDDADLFTRDDYRRYVDGKPRYDGAQSFLDSRDIDLPRGDPEDAPGRETVCGLGNRKNQIFHELLERDGVERIEPSIAWAREAGRRGVALAVVTSSRNGKRVLEAAGIEDLFRVRVDGNVGHDLGLPGKPDPAYFLEAARRLDVEAGQAAVVEDAESGVKAGSAGGFGLVVGIGEDGDERLRKAGADIVIPDLGHLPLPPAGTPIRDVPLLLEGEDPLSVLVADDGPALFLDYDGTLTPIVPDPDDARLPEATRATLERAAAALPLGIVSGRDLDVLRDFVRVDGIYYAGSHGLHIREPDGTEHERARDWLPALDRAERRIRQQVEGIPGAEVERKRFAIAVHYRNTPEDRIADVKRIAREEVDREDSLEGSGGKKVVELRPDLDWDKGSAVSWMLSIMADGRTLHPAYIGDDVTDEDAFRALPSDGLAVVVRGEDDDRRTAARFAVAGPDQVRQLIERLLDVLKSTREDS